MQPCNVAILRLCRSSLGADMARCHTKIDSDMLAAASRSRTASGDLSIPDCPSSNGSIGQAISGDPSSNTSESWRVSDTAQVVPPSTDALELIPAAQKQNAITSLRDELNELFSKRKLDMVSPLCLPSQIAQAPTDVCEPAFGSTASCFDLKFFDCCYQLRGFRKKILHFVFLIPDVCACACVFTDADCLSINVQEVLTLMVWLQSPTELSTYLECRIALAINDQGFSEVRPPQIFFLTLTHL